MPQITTQRSNLVRKFLSDDELSLASRRQDDKTVVNSVHCTFLGNYPPTPPLSQHFALSEKCQRWLRGGVGGHLRTGVITK